MSITIIDFTIATENLNLKELSKEQRATLKSAMARSARFEVRGFQEVLGLTGRVVNVAMGGYWRGRSKKKFTVTSFGFHHEGQHVYSGDNGAVVTKAISEARH